MARIRISAGTATTTHELGDEPMTIGRGTPNFIPLADLASSSRHAEIVRDSLGWRLQDRGSRNGTFVNGRQVQSVLLSHGDQIQIGATEITFEDPPASSADQTAARPGVSHATSFLQSLIAEEETSDAASLPALMQSLVIDDAPADDDPSSHFEYMRIDGPRSAKNTSTIRLKKQDTISPAGTTPLAEFSQTQPPAESLAEVKLRLIQRVSEKLVKIFDPKQLLDEIMSIVIEQTRADRGILCLLDADRQPVPIATRGLGDEEQVRFSRNVLRRLLEDRAGVVISQNSVPVEGGSAALRSLAEMRVYSTMCVPLWTGEDIIGILSLDSTTEGKAFSQEDLELLLAVAHQAAMGIERGRLSKMVESEQQKRAYLSKYLDNRIVQQITDDGTGQASLAPAERVITVLFSDIVSFTKMSEGLQPAEVASFVRDYLTVMTDIIFAHGGTIDKYIGDAVMALFGAPVASDSAPADAVRAALEMRERLKGFQPPGGKSGTLRARFGINTGLAVVGNIGSSRRMEYTALGDTVNVASRLQTFARPNEICIDEVTCSKTAGAFAVEEIGTVDVKNRAEGIVVYKVLRSK